MWTVARVIFIVHNLVCTELVGLTSREPTSQFYLLTVNKTHLEIFPCPFSVDSILSLWSDNHSYNYCVIFMSLINILYHGLCWRYGVSIGYLVFVIVAI